MKTPLDVAPPPAAEVKQNQPAPTSLNPTQQEQADQIADLRTNPVASSDPHAPVQDPNLLPQVTAQEAAGNAPEGSRPSIFHTNPGMNGIELAHTQGRVTQEHLDSALLEVTNNIRTVAQRMNEPGAFTADLQRLEAIRAAIGAAYHPLAAREADNAPVKRQISSPAPHPPAAANPA